MWVMAASPLLTCNDVRNMSASTKEILTNEEVLAVHKDPLAQMAVRIDVGGGLEGRHAANLCASSYSVYGKQLADGSSAVMLLNRGTANASVPLLMEDVGDSMHSTYAARDLWARANLSATPLHESTSLMVPAHGVRLLRLWPVEPPPPPACPADFETHAAGYWYNTEPCPNNVWSNCTEDQANGTVALCAEKCRSASGCVAFEMPLSASTPPACYIFRHTLAPPFTPYAAALTCVAKSA